MAQALYRKHRPKSLSEVVGQEHITDTLSNALKQGTISHAYLLTGPRGTGKTSVARILAYEVNELPYDEEGTHLDIIEIDAASNRRIDEIRELKERVNIAPTSAKYKVYIIDEVHMLTKEAFNALLKTLEEPPQHAIFILATTEAHKVPDTIISRTQRFTFKPVDLEKVIEHLKQIAKDEKIIIDDAALALIAAHGEGSFRDSISLLDQVRHTGSHISLADVQQAVGQAPDELLNDLLAALKGGQTRLIASSLGALRTHGAQAPPIAKQLSSLIREGIVGQSAALPLRQSLELLSDLLHVPASNDPGLALELACYKSALSTEPSKLENIAPVAENVAQATPHQSAEKKPEAKSSTSTQKPPAEKTAKSDQKTTAPNRASGLLDDASWLDVLAAVKAKHNTLYSIVRMAVPQFEKDKLTLCFLFPFHQKRLNDNKNMQILLGIINQVTGLDVSLDCVLDTSAKSVLPIEKPEIKHPDELNLQTISNIFGGAEIVE